MRPAEMTVPKPRLTPGGSVVVEVGVVVEVASEAGV